MHEARLGLEAREQLALLRTGLASVDDVHTWANDRLTTAFDGPALVALSEVERRLDETAAALGTLVESCGAPRLEQDDSVAEACASVARAVKSGEISIVDGARLMWSNLLPLDPDNRHLLEIGGAISEWDDDIEHRAEYEEDIRVSIEAVLLEAQDKEDLRTPFPER